MNMTNQSPAASAAKLIEQPWLMLGQASSAIAPLIKAALEGEVSLEGIADPSGGGYEVEDGVAMLTFHGIVGKRLGLWEKAVLGMLDLDDFNEQLNAAAEDDDVRAIEIDFDSPGGSITGVPETMRNLARVDSIKPVTARTETLMASAAYFIASQSRRIVASESARVGAIGVYMVKLDKSEIHSEAGVVVDVIKNNEALYKAAGVLDTALSSEQREQMQESLQGFYDRSVAMIKSRRPSIKDEAMMGQVLFGAESFWGGAGLIDDLI